MSYQGEGQSVALVEPGGQFYLGDIGAYVSHFGLPTNAGAIVTRYINGASADTPRDPNGESECVLDIDMVLAMAPRINHIFVYVSPTLDSDNFVEVLGAIADENLAQSVSASIGVGETGLEISDSFTVYQSLFNQLEQIYERMASSGPVHVRLLRRHRRLHERSASPSAPSVPPHRHRRRRHHADRQQHGNGRCCPMGARRPGERDGARQVRRRRRHQQLLGQARLPVPNAQSLVGPVGEGGLVTPAMRDVPDVSLNADPNTGYAIYVGDTTAPFTNGFGNNFQVVGGTSASVPALGGLRRPGQRGPRPGRRGADGGRDPRHPHASGRLHQPTDLRHQLRPVRQLRQ